jgi:hypothetical protein
MSLDTQVQRVLEISFHDNLYELCEHQALVTETSTEGEAQVTCLLPQGSTGIRWKIEKAELFPFLRKQLAADGALILRQPDGAYEAHIMECKLTINQDTWDKAKRQMGWSLLRLRALAGVLGIQFQRVVCYTAYRSEKWEPGLLKVPLGDLVAADETQARTIELLQRQGDWLDPGIELRGFDQQFLHRKVMLDAQTGAGQVILV